MKDPLDINEGKIIRRITGNLGKPGFTILVPPADPRIREIGYASWRLVHEAFDGELLDSFKSTSLHLSLTGYQLPISTGHRRVRDAECTVVESAVSLYDKSEWVGDPDVVKFPEYFKNTPSMLGCTC